jgi:hypothetical protein
MTYRKIYNCYLTIIISAFFTTISYAQNIDDLDLIMYQTPSPKFHDITLQSYKGLPRFGYLNSYTKKNSLAVSPKSQDPRRQNPRGQSLRRPDPRKQDPVTKKKNNKISLSYENYIKMVTFKYLADIYKDLDRERLTKTPPGNITGKQKNSYEAQRYLRNLLTLCVEEECKNSLYGKNEFERLRNYKTFVNENLDVLRKWSNTFFTNNNVIGYDVTYLVLSTYDFDKNGYWTNLNLNINIGYSRGVTVSTIFEPKANYENDLLNKTAGNSNNKIYPLKIFLAISPEKAEKLQLNNIKRLYLVKKIKISHKEVVSNYRTPFLKLTYHHESPTMEIYEDIALTKKFGTLSLDKLIIKQQ